MSTLEQKLRRESYRVELIPNGMTYTWSGPGGDGSAPVGFELLSRRTTSFRRRFPFYRNAAVYFAILAVLTIGFGFLVEVRAATGIVWAVLSLASSLVYRYAGASYEVFPLADGRVLRLLKNKPSTAEYAAFRTELFAQRDDYLRSRYARVNIERPSEAERKRIDWLRAEGVIDEIAYVTIVETIEEHAPHA